MMTQGSRSPLESRVSDHLRPMMPVIEEQAKKEDMQGQFANPSQQEGEGDPTPVV